MVSFLLATFSLDGGVIYAINYHQELLLIDPITAMIISKRKIDELKDFQTVISIQMMQIDPKLIVIGSLCKSPSEGFGSSIPYLFVLSGDLLSPEAKIDLISFKMSLKGKIDPEKLLYFRFLYVNPLYIPNPSESTD